MRIDLVSGWYYTLCLFPKKQFRENVFCTEMCKQYLPTEIQYFLGTNINPETNYPLLKLFIQGGSVCHCTNVKRNIHVFYYKCTKPEKFNRIYKNETRKESFYNKWSCHQQIIILNEFLNKFKFTNESLTIYVLVDVHWKKR